MRWRPALQVLAPHRRHLRSSVVGSGSAAALPPASATMRYAERRLLGFSQEQMYTVVSGVEHYHRFVPWCIASSATGRQPLADVADAVAAAAGGNVGGVGDDVGGSGERFTGHMSIGFPPVLRQQYDSIVTCRRPQLVHSRCSDAALFRLLDTTWRFHPGLAGCPATCIVDFGVAFAFQSSLHTALADLFFDRVVTAMVAAFMREARRRYGPDSVPPQKPTVLVYKR